MTTIIQRGNVIDVPFKGAHQRRVVAYTYEHPSGIIAATLPADLPTSGWLSLDVREARLSDDQTVDWSGEAGELRREAFEEHVERAPYVPRPWWTRLNKYMSLSEVLSLAFGAEAAREFEDLCNGKIPDRYVETAP